MSTVDGHIYKRFHARKNHAKKHNIPFDITLDYMKEIWTDTCPILGIPLSWCVQSGHKTDNSPSIDRIFPEKGYVKGNVSWVSERANTIKNCGSAEEHLCVYNFMMRNVDNFL
jgi:hypothetical protein